jgi:hypothetical protein
MGSRDKRGKDSGKGANGAIILRIGVACTRRLWSGGIASGGWEQPRLAVAKGERSGSWRRRLDAVQPGDMAIGRRRRRAAG